jgi:molybdopterin molybdotransferase
MRDAYDRAADPADWLDLEEATGRVLAACDVLDDELVDLGTAVRRVLAEPIRSTIDLPPWDNSAMDGFAVRADDVRRAAADAPVALHVVDAVPAGGFATRSVEPGTAIRIMTGAPIPAGADSVIRVEHTRMQGDHVLVNNAGDAGRNVRRRGEDIRRGETVLERGRLLRPGEIGVLASLGHARVRVVRQPRVAILSTGDELTPLERFAEAAAGRRIVDSNSWTLAAAALIAGAEPMMLGIARDDATSLRERLGAARGADVLVTTAGASVGDHDIVKDVLNGMGFRPAFWRVRMRPGSPVSFGTLPSGSEPALPVFGLPGNPVSALVTWTLLVRPALRRLSGREAVHVPTIRVRLAQRVESKRGLAHFLRARLTPGPNGLPVAHLTGPQGSGMLSSLAAADALLVVPATRDALEAGEAALAVPLDTGDDAAAQFEVNGPTRSN